ncbi:MAG: hypothetical protein H7248_07060 [Microbacteriaceae bacterium]|nr:hypothetical protein [Microbacteriaceae bacterium]
MGTDGIGSSIVVALAAILWLAYLTPTWFRQREYHATERNAVRLQQTLRILAETSEVPERVTAETTARSVLAHEKLVRGELKRAEAINRAKGIAMSRAAARTLASLKPEVAATVISHSPAAYRLRRARVIGLGSFAVSLALIFIGFASFSSAAGGVLVTLGAIGTVAAVFLMRKLAVAAQLRSRVARELGAQPAPARQLGHPLLEFADEPAVATPWTPVPLPKPLYIGRPLAQPLVSAAATSAASSTSAIDHARATLVADAAEAEQLLREAHTENRVTPIIRTAAAESRFTRMGIVDGSVTTVTDLDAALRRRRAV